MLRLSLINCAQFRFHCNENAQQRPLPLPLLRNVARDKHLYNDGVSDGVLALPFIHMLLLCVGMYMQNIQIRSCENVSCQYLSASLDARSACLSSLRLTLGDFPFQLSVDLTNVPLIIANLGILI